MTGTERSYLARPLRAREDAHRRSVLLWIGALIVLGTSPVVGHHLAGQVAVLLTGRDHILGVCLIALHLLLAPVHSAFHVVLGAGVAYAIWDRARAWQRLRQTLRCLDWEAPAPKGTIARAAESLGLPLDRIRVAEGLPDPAFTAGWYRPRVYIDSALVELLPAEGVQVVLAHESAHVTRRDPLRLSLLRGLACTVFYLPMIRRLADDAADEAEIAADDIATASIPKGPLVLAAAIVEIAKYWGRGATSASDLLQGGAAIGFQRVDLLDRRVRRLLGESTTVGTHVTRRSLAGAGATLMGAWISGLIMAHPLPPTDWRAGSSPSAHEMATLHGPHASLHCTHHAAFPSTHLFCLGWRDRSRSAPCPHATAMLRSHPTSRAAADSPAAVG